MSYQHGSEKTASEIEKASIKAYIHLCSIYSNIVLVSEEEHAAVFQMWADIDWDIRILSYMTGHYPLPGTARRMKLTVDALESCDIGWISHILPHVVARHVERGLMESICIEITGKCLSHSSTAVVCNGLLSASLLFGMQLDVRWSLSVPDKRYGRFSLCI